MKELTLRIIIIICCKKLIHLNAFNEKEKIFAYNLQNNVRTKTNHNTMNVFS